MTAPTEEPTPLREQAGALLRTARERGGMSRSAAAQALGVTRQSTMTWERGVVSLDRLEQLAQTFGITVALVAVDSATGEVVAVAPPAAVTEP